MKMLELKKREEYKKLADENILLIGGAGFIGSHLAEQLFVRGARIIVLDDLSTGRKENLEKFPHLLLESSIEESDIPGILREFDIARVFFLACGSLASSLNDPERDFNANVANTFKSLEAFRKYEKGKAFVYCSTGSVYGEPEKENYTETEPLRPSTPYGTSKACGDLYAQLYHGFFDLPIRIVRYNNIFGPRKRGTAIPIFIEKALLKEVITIEGGKQVRTPTFVLDAVAATMLAGLVDKAIGEPLNISSDESLTIEEIVELIWKLVNGQNSEPKVEFTNYRLGEIMFLKPSIEKAKIILNWQPFFRFRKGLEILIPYIKEEIEKR